jgi:demethylmenaquinone methyltransferase/2-methoxy-6-polyprenyl-1,4-benzoquinol methylase
MERRRAVTDDLIHRDPRLIEAMFDQIEPRYDLMNWLMTAGMDTHWRRIAAAAAAPGIGESVLDACCGTGDLALMLAGMYPRSSIVGLDFSPAMLSRAHRKAATWENRHRRRPPRFVRGDLLDLPFGDGEFGAVTVGWGVRNVADLAQALKEMSRVTRPGGRIVCLEATDARAGVGRHVQRVWMGRVVPTLGSIIAGQAEAYAYLPASVRSFPCVEELAGVMAEAGLGDIRYRRLGFGAVAVHVAVVPAVWEHTAALSPPEGRG